MKKILAILLAVLMLSSSFALAETSETPDWMVPYDETISLTWGRSAQTNPWPEPDSTGENEWVRWIEKLSTLILN